MRQVLLTVDLGFGDAGKGSIVDFLTRAYHAHTVVRYNGGAQAGHRVVVAGDSPQEHVFAQFGSGTLAGADTHLSRFMLLDPLAMLVEEQHLHTLGVTDAFQRTTIDARALIITPFQRAINRLKEVARGPKRHGSCGMGIGETMADYLAHGNQVLFAGNLANRDALYQRLRFLQTVNLDKWHALQPDLPDSEAVACEQEWLTDTTWIDWLIDAYDQFSQQARIMPGDYLSTLLRRDGTVVFEGAQGVLLDEWHGFHPHTTWSTTTLACADQLLTEAGYTGQQTRIGITRAYATRHGSGPLVTEDARLTRALPDACNRSGDWQHGFRVGWLDLVMLRYARDVVGHLDYLALTCLDRLFDLPTIQVCRRYRYDTFMVERIAPAPTPHALDYQQQITHNLAHCTPEFETVCDAWAIVNVLTDSLGVAVGLISTGPTAADKQMLPSSA